MSKSKSSPKPIYNLIYHRFRDQLASDAARLFQLEASGFYVVYAWKINPKKNLLDVFWKEVFKLYLYTTVEIIPAVQFPRPAYVLLISLVSAYMTSNKNRLLKIWRKITDQSFLLKTVFRRSLRCFSGPNSDFVCSRKIKWFSFWGTYFFIEFKRLISWIPFEIIFRTCLQYKNPILSSLAKYVIQLDFWDFEEFN